MGALHAGHQSLISRARELCDEVVVSVFVNPLQFEDKDDLAKYPHTPELDEELAREAGATILWRPEYNAIYPDSIVKLSAGELGRKFNFIPKSKLFLLPPFANSVVLQCHHVMCDSMMMLEWQLM